MVPPCSHTKTQREKGPLGAKLMSQSSLRFLLPVLLLVRVRVWRERREAGGGERSAVRRAALERGRAASRGMVSTDTRATTALQPEREGVRHCTALQTAQCMDT
jgi:hypothetical protein